MFKAFTLPSVLLLYLAVGACGPSTPENAEPNSAPAKLSIPTGPKVTCPVCGLTFSQSDAVGFTTANGKTYYFYLEDHMKAFKNDPNAYLGN